MATTTATTTSTPTPTVTQKSVAGVTKSATQSILESLNTGSGVDTDALVTGLVQAQFAAKNAAITARANALTAQISATTTLKDTISRFSTALASLSGSGTLQTQPVSSDSAAVSASAISGAKVGALSTSITVSALATAQSVRSAAVDSRTAPIGTGQLKLTLGTAIYDEIDGTMTGVTPGTAGPVLIDVTDGSLNGIATAINAAKTGVTASIITDQDGKSVLSLKGATGAAQAFTMTAQDESSPLAQFNVGGKDAPMTLTAKAGNARLTVDGVEVQRSSNTIADLVPGVRLQLSTVTKAPVNFSSTRPTTALSQAVTDFVETYNQVYAAAKEQTDPVTGDLKADPAAKALLRSLQGLTTRTLTSSSSAGAPTTMAQLGIGTNRDGTLKVDTTMLNKVMTDYPDEIEAMFLPTSGNALGLSSTLSGISITAASSVTGLGASASRYSKAQKDLTTEQAKVTSQSEVMTTRMTQQFASMNSKVTAYKATQTFLDNQIKAWNKDS